MSFIASYARTMAGARRIAQERMHAAQAAGLPAPAGFALETEPDAESTVIAFVSPVREIINDVAARHGLTYQDIIGASRFKNIVTARMDAIVEVHKARPTMSLGQLGKAFHRDHTTILHALRKRGLK